MDFQVRKGLETPLKVHGMSTKYFLVYLGGVKRNAINRVVRKNSNSLDK